MRLIKATAEYTGGGVYILYGKTATGSYWMGGLDDMIYSIELDADPTATEESGYPEWQETHKIKDYPTEDALKHIEAALKYILANKPKGNYAPGEIKTRLDAIKRYKRAWIDNP